MVKQLILALLILLLLAVPASAATDYFRESRAVAWTLYGNGDGDVTRDFSIEFQYEISGVALMPPPFSDLGWAPTAVVGNLTYESNPAGETGDVIWSRVTAYYDNLFGSEYIEGRAIYEDQAQGSHLGSGIGFRPVGNIWIGGFYLTGGDFLFHGEGAYRISDEIVCFGQIDYYNELDVWEGELGFEMGEAAFVAVENRFDEWIIKLGAVHKL